MNTARGDGGRLFGEKASMRALEDGWEDGWRCAAGE